MQRPSDDDGRAGVGFHRDSLAGQCMKNSLMMIDGLMNEKYVSRPRPGFIFSPQAAIYPRVAGWGRARQVRAPNMVGRLKEAEHADLITE